MKGLERDTVVTERIHVSIQERVGGIIWKRGVGAEGGGRRVGGS